MKKVKIQWIKMNGMIFVTIVHYKKIKKTLWLLIVLVQVVYGVDISEKKYLSEACNKGNIKACFEFAEFYYSGISNGAYDDSYYKILVESYRKSCNYGKARACERLGDMYLFARGVNWDIQRGYKFTKKACDLNDSLGCSDLGLLYNEGIIFLQDYKKSLKFYEKACILTKSISDCKDRDRLLLKVFSSLRRSPS